MDQDHGELTLADILADPVTLALMDADGVDPVVLAATLSQKAGDLMRPARPVNRRRRVTDDEVDKAVIAECEADVSVESRKSVAMARSPRAVRNTLRLASALVLLAFVVCHLTAHSFLLISLERAGAALDILMYPWRTAVRRRPFFVAVALLLPTFALSGYVSAGNQVLRAAQNPDYVKFSLEASNLTDKKRAEIGRIARAGAVIYIALALLPFAGRGVRGWVYRHRRRPLLTHSNGQTVPMLPGATVLETLRENGIPHASVCGGRARCTTCRILVTKGLRNLPEPSALEAKALARIGAAPGMRLACQIRPSADISVMPLLAADAMAADGMVRAGLEGSERPITVMFVDLRGATILGEAKLPYDLLYILNQFFDEMIKALNATNGYYSQFTGDGLMALYGLNANDPATGAADALRGAREMLARVAQLNSRLRGDLPQPMRIGIGIHFSEAIVGAMGPPGSQIITAIGDTVNACKRLESLTKEYDCAVVVSRRAADMAGLDVKGRKLHQASVQGRTQTVEFYALKTMADLRV
jgi:adenylate cyclase